MQKTQRSKYKFNKKTPKNNAIRKQIYMEKRQHKCNQNQNKLYLHAHNPFGAIGTINTTFYTLQISNI